MKREKWRSGIGVGFGLQGALLGRFSADGTLPFGVLSDLLQCVASLEHDAARSSSGEGICPRFMRVLDYTVVLHIACP